MWQMKYNKALILMQMNLVMRFKMDTVVRHVCVLECNKGIYDVSGRSVRVQFNSLMQATGEHHTTNLKEKHRDDLKCFKVTQKQ